MTQLHLILFCGWPAEAAEGAHNIVPISARVWSGPRPTPEDFARLKELGVRTAINVDGARPDIAAAKAVGIRYLHIPIGYDGIPDAAAAALAKALREVEGPFYIHCHHGKHRGPAMAAIALRLETGADATEARQVMEEAGTSADYAGLWRDVEAFDAREIADLEPELHEIAPVGRMTEAMASLDMNWDHLLMLQENDWGALEAHPDLVAVEEAKQMLEIYEALLRTGRYREDFGRMLVDGVNSARALQSAIASGDAAARAAAMKAAKASCAACHKDYRNGGAPYEAGVAGQ